MWKSPKDIVRQACSKLISTQGIALNVASRPFLHSVLNACEEYGKGTETPALHEIMNKYLCVEKQEIEDLINAQKQNTWNQFGATPLCNGWTSGIKQQIMDFLNCVGITYYPKSVGASFYVMSPCLAKLMEGVIVDI